MNRILFAAVLLLMLSACAVAYFQPRTSEGVTVEDRFAIMRTDSLLVAVRPQAYHNSANNLAQSYFCIYIHVRNLSGSTKRISPTGFSIMAGERQFDYIPLNLIAGSLQNQLMSDPFEFNPDPADQQSLIDREEKKRENLLELINSYFSFGDLLPGGRKEGYLFYNRDLSRAKTLSIDAFGQALIFDYGHP